MKEEESQTEPKSEQFVYKGFGCVFLYKGLLLFSGYKNNFKKLLLLSN